MRKIDKPTKVPAVLAGSTCITERKALVSNRLALYSGVLPVPTRKSVNRDLYRGDKTDINSVYSVLFNLYNGKCGYCEEERSNLDVEHYRPKNRVKEVVHPGYFWLSYEWQNLFLACKECNRDHKKDLFPVVIRIDPGRVPLKNRTAQHYNLQELKDHERPAIINPEEKDFDPLNYFQINLKGEPSGIDTERRGQETIDKCDLTRGDVNKRRQSIIDKIRLLIKAHLHYLAEDESNYTTILNNIRNCIRENVVLNDPTIEHTMVHQLIKRDYKTLILPPLNAEYHKIVLEAFQLEFP